MILSRQQTREHLRNAILKGADKSIVDHLPASQKKVVYARFWDGLSYQLVAKRLNFSIQHVKDLESRAIDNLSD